MRRALVLLISFGAFVVIAATIQKPARAAPDKTLGMALMAAHAKGDGSLVKGAGVTGISRISAGQYVVSFDRDVSQCFYSTMVGGGFYHVALPRNGDPAAVHVLLVFADAGAFVDGEFQLLVFCNK